MKDFLMNVVAPTFIELPHHTDLIFLIRQYVEEGFINEFRLRCYSEEVFTKLTIPTNYNILLSKIYMVDSQFLEAIIDLGLLMSPKNKAIKEMKNVLIQEKQNFKQGL